MQQSSGETRDYQIIQTVKNLSTAALGGVCEATGEVSEDLTNLTKTVVINAVQGVQEVTGVVGSAALDNVRGSLKAAALVGEDLGVLGKDAARGLIRGASEVGADLGAAAKSAAIGWIHGSAEVGAELGKVLKQGALSAIQGSGEISAELGALAKSQALGAIHGGSETALSLENALMLSAQAFLRGMAELKADRMAEVARPTEPTSSLAGPPIVPTATYSDIPPVVMEKPGKAKSNN